VSGNAAQVSYNDVAGTITIDIDAAATSANTVVDAFRFEPLFAASLDEATANDGTGIIGFTGSSGKPISCRCWILSRRADLA
jgi:hypothetical protein